MAEAVSVSGPVSGTEKNLSFSAGKLAQLANGAVVVQMGNTVVLVTATEELGGPHELSRRRTAPRARLGEYLASTEGAALRDALAAASGWFDALFVIRPAHNPVAPLDTEGAYDERSDRVQAVGELVDRGYEDAYRQFIDPVVGASGEQMSAAAAAP